jgi:hypothetical protein
MKSTAFLGGILEPILGSILEPFLGGILGPFYKTFYDISSKILRHFLVLL